MMKFDELKQKVQEQYKNREITDDLRQPITVKRWKQTNSFIRNKLRAERVKFRTCFYNPNDHKIYIKQSFRTTKIDGLSQIANTYEDVLCFVLDGEEKHIQGHWDDEYIAIHFIEICKRCN